VNLQQRRVLGDLVRNAATDILMDLGTEIEERDELDVLRDVPPAELSDQVDRWIRHIPSDLMHELNQRAKKRAV
jgi:hypothetical protein